MNQFGLRYLYKHLGKALHASNLPFQITNHNRVVATVYGNSQPSKEKNGRGQRDSK